MASLKRILFAGDELRLIQIVRQAFEGTGAYLIEEERDWRMAFQTAERFQPNIIFFDLGFGEFGWNEAIRQIKGNAVFAGTPIFMLTLSEDKDSILYRGSLNGYDFSVSPIRIEEFLRSIEQMLAA